MSAETKSFKAKINLSITIFSPIFSHFLCFFFRFFCLLLTFLKTETKQNETQCDDAILCRCALCVYKFIDKIVNRIARFKVESPEKFLSDTSNTRALHNNCTYNNALQRNVESIEKRILQWYNLWEMESPMVAQPSKIILTKCWFLFENEEIPRYPSNHLFK